MRIVSASGNPSGMDVVLQNAGVTHGLFPNAVLQDVAAWRSSMLTVQERHGEEAGPVTVVFRSARGCVDGSQVPFSDDLWYAARMHEGRHHHVCCLNPRGKEAEASFLVHWLPPLRKHPNGIAR